VVSDRAQRLRAVGRLGNRGIRAEQRAQTGHMWGARGRYESGMFHRCLTIRQGVLLVNSAIFLRHQVRASTASG
jgi:hypothetical protein